MSEDRIKELQIFVDDFKHKLKQARERYEKKISKTMLAENDRPKSKSKGYNSINNDYKKKKFRHRYVNNIFNVYPNYSKKIYSSPQIHGFPIHFLANLWKISKN